MGITFDSNFLIDLIRGRKAAVAKARELEGRKQPKLLTTPVLYEVSIGIHYVRSRSEAATFRAYASRFQIADFDAGAAGKAAEIQAELMRLGRPKAHTDVMLAGIALHGSHVLVTADRDFARISAASGLIVEDY